MSKSRAKRRYTMAVLGCSAGYAAAVFGANAYFHNHPGTQSVTGYLAAVIPALLIIGIFFAIGRYLIEEQDEYLRMLMVRQSLWASGFALSVATVWGFLESFDLVGHVPSYAVAILWFGGLGLGSVMNKLTLGKGA